MNPNTPEHIVQRNRINARLSTGPRTAAGKAISRSNAVKHGLCANPASETVEDSNQFRELQAELLNRFQPNDPVESVLVNRVAVCLWRLLRAARIDAALGDLAVSKIPDQDDQIRTWLQLLNSDGWYAKPVKESDKAVLERLKNKKRIKRKETVFRLKRPWLTDLDRMREEQIVHCGAGLTAMGYMISDLMNRIEASPGSFTPVEAQQLAWLLGESAERLRLPEQDRDIGRDESFYPDEQQWASQTDRLIGQARSRSEGTPVPRQLVAMAKGMLQALRQQRIACDDPRTLAHHENKRIASLLPDVPTLDRLLRYEAHAERSLQRSMRTLAEYRGATVEMMSTTLTCNQEDGSSLKVHGERTRWATKDTNS